MKKFLFSILIILICMFVYIPSTQIVYAEDNNTIININTLYPKNVYHYQNLDNITNVTACEKYIAYSLTPTTISILNNETKKLTELSSFNNIYDIKYVKNNQLIVVDYVLGGENNKISIITLSEDNTPTIRDLNNISLTNVQAIDIFEKDETVLIGIVSNNQFNLYEISNSTALEDPTIKESSNYEGFSGIKFMAMGNNSQVVVYENGSNELRLFKRNYHAEDSSIIPLNISENILNKIILLDYYDYDTKEYLISVTSDILSILDATTFQTINEITNVDINNIDIINDTIIASNRTDIISENNYKGLINSYIIDNTNNIATLKQKDILVCSSHNSLGRFKDVNDIYVQGDHLFISDTNNDRIQIIDKDLNCTEISNLQIDSNPHSVIVDNNQNLYFTKSTGTNTSSLEKYSMEDNLYTYSQSFSTGLGQVSDATLTNKNEIFLIDYTNNKLVYLNNNTSLQQIYSFNFVTNSNTKIEYLKQLNKFVILNNDNFETTLYLLDYDKLINNEDPIITSINIENAKDISANINSIITLCDNEIILVEIKNDIMQISENILENDIFTRLSCIKFDIMKNKIWGFDTRTQSVIYFDYNLTNEEFSFTYINDPILLEESSSPFGIEILNNAIITDLPYHIGNQYPEINECIGIESYDNYYRVLFEYEGKLNIGFLEKSNANIKAYNSTKQLAVLTTNQEVPVYKYPTLLKQNDHAIITSYIPISTYISISYNSFPISIDNKLFYEYKVDGKIGYIFNADVVLSDSKNIVPLNIDNAKVNSINNDTINIYDKDKTTILYTLTNEDRVFVENYDKKSEYTLVTFKLPNLNTVTGYVKTEYIEMDELDNTQIILIIIIVVSIIILITIFITYMVIKKKRLK